MKRALAGWGRTRPTVAELVPADSEQIVVDSLRHVGTRGVIARGLGRSYGDAAQNGGGLVLDGQPLCELEWHEHDPGVVTAGAGLTIEALLRVVVPRGWFVPVTPGTRYVTVGGALAADIHGKNHHRDGSLARHVLGFRIVTPALGVVDVAPGDELFKATLGGMGLTGVIVEATLRLVPIETALMAVDTEQAGDLDRLFTRLTELDHERRYTVAWIDVLSRGAKLGRGVITAAEHAPLDALPSARQHDPLRFAPRALVGAPRWIPSGLLNPMTIALFNEAWYRKAPPRRLGQLQQISTYFHPLDGVRHWNRLYGPRGFLQYQILVPNRETEVLRHVIETFANSRLPGFLAVLKRFGDSSGGYLSFPAPGWTLTVDLPAQPELSAILDALDDRVVEAGGRIYLAKDARMKPHHLPVMYPNFGRWTAMRAMVDPDRVLQSDLSRRLGL